MWYPSPNFTLHGGRLVVHVAYVCTIRHVVHMWFVSICLCHKRFLVAWVAFWLLTALARHGFILGWPVTALFQNGPSRLYSAKAKIRLLALVGLALGCSSRRRWFALFGSARGDVARGDVPRTGVCKPNGDHPQHVVADDTWSNSSAWAAGREGLNLVVACAKQ